MSSQPHRVITHYNLNNCHNVVCPLMLVIMMHELLISRAEVLKVEMCFLCFLRIRAHGH